MFVARLCQPLHACSFEPQVRARILNRRHKLAMASVAEPLQVRSRQRPHSRGEAASGICVSQSRGQGVIAGNEAHGTRASVGSLVKLVKSR